MNLCYRSDSNSSDFSGLLMSASMNKEGVFIYSTMVMTLVVRLKSY